MRRILLTIGISVLLIVGFTACGSDEKSEDAPVIGTCTITVEEFCEEKEMDLHEGDTVYDILQATGAEIVDSDTGTGKAIESINGLENGSRGDMSGWMYTVNGKSPMDYSDKFEVSDGDSIVWEFAEDM
ncbi:MAG: DUF4430 domain-containing protein [Clostridiales bacterium]|nr:DUF4430 domain-containing protein [Clostridiales bacterium]MDD7035761.1 DUF4430 domain-containing protein [Bacillota bacterium]MDY2921090.1 DUF4430 domain-containing protein [Lentihominibacter sp.]